jgi:hypothetical protein
MQVGSFAGHRGPHSPTQVRLPHAADADHTPHATSPEHVTRPWHAAFVLIACAMSSGSPVAAAMTSAWSSLVIPVDDIAATMPCSVSDSCETSELLVPATHAARHANTHTRQTQIECFIFASALGISDIPMRGVRSPIEQGACPSLCWNRCARHDSHVRWTRSAPLSAPRSNILAGRSDQTPCAAGGLRSCRDGRGVRRYRARVSSRSR